MGEFFSELKRRHVYRVGAAYAVVAWVLLQLVNNLAPAFKLPDWTVTLVVILLVIGFPIALIFAWTMELKAPAADGAPVRAAATRMDFVLAGALAVVIGLILYEQLTPSTRARTVQQAGIAAPSPGGISVAVLPFTNVSDDAGQEFFSDGMTDEIMTALAKVPALRVVARTSAFQFKGQNRDIQAISQALHARYVIDGSVRKAGNRVRITAQLVQADNGVNVWADSYDRELTDVFATQEDIAKAIAGALRVPLGLQQGETLVKQSHQRSGLLSAISPRQGAGTCPRHRRSDRRAGTGCRSRSRLCAGLGDAGRGLPIGANLQPDLADRFPRRGTPCCAILKRQRGSHRTKSH